MFTIISYIIVLAGIGFALFLALLVFDLVDDIMNRNHEDWLILTIMIIINFIFSFSLIRGGIMLWNLLE